MGGPLSIIRLTPEQSRCLPGTPTSTRHRFGPPCPIRFRHLDNPCYPIRLILRRSKRLHFRNRFPLRKCNRGRCLSDNPPPADVTRTTAFTLGTSPCSSLDLGRRQNLQSKKIAWIFLRQLQRSKSGRVMTVCGLGSGSADNHPHPIIPLPLHHHLDPALLDEAITISIQCPTIFSRSSNQGHNTPIWSLHLDPHRRVPL
jgi:hypothetical protein